MAVCQIWDVRGRLDRPINYATNKDKTSEVLEDSKVQGLYDVMEYASNSKKTTFDNEVRYVSAINCNINTARQDMILTKRAFCDDKEITAFHGFQSFKKDEVTPSIAHQIGLELAEKMWGDRFEIVVATHLNTDCVHNHFVINSTSFKDGKRFYDNKEHLRKLRKTSDEICLAHNLSVIENPSHTKSNTYLYKADKKDMPTRYNTLKSAIDDAISHSFTKDDFFKQMDSMGYKLDFRNSRKYATIVPKGYEKPIRINKLGEDYTRERIFSRISENSIAVKSIPISPATKQTGYRNITHHSIKIARKKGGLQGLYLHYCYLLGILPAKTKRNNARLHYLLKDDLMKLDKISSQVNFIYKYNLNNSTDLNCHKEKILVEQKALIDKRKLLWNKTRSATDLEPIKSEIAICSNRLKEIRTELKNIDEILIRSKTIEDKLDQTYETLTRKERFKDEPFR